MPDLAAALEFDSNRIPYVDFEKIVTGCLIAVPAG